MTTKPKHTTCRHRHTTDSRISKARTQKEQAERDLPFVFEYKAKPGTWESTAEHEAAKAIKQAGLIAWAHLETVNPEVSV